MHFVYTHVYLCIVTVHINGVRNIHMIGSNSFPCVGISSEDELSAFLAESLIMKDFKHPHVLGLEGVCFDTPDGSPYIILPFMSNGSVKTYLKERRVHPTNFDSCPTVYNYNECVHYQVFFLGE